MAGGSFVNVGGVWRTVKNIYVNVGGVWRQVKNSYANVGGVWRTAYQAMKQIYTAGVQNVPLTGSLGQNNASTNQIVWNASSIYMVGYGNHSDGTAGWDGAIVSTSGLNTFDVTGYTTLCVDCDCTSNGGGRVAIYVDNMTQNVIYTTTQSVTFSRTTLRLTLAPVTGLSTVHVCYQGYNSSGFAKGNVYNIWVE